MKVNGPLVTVAVCTHNRARSLERTLSCLERLEPADAFEVLVVDNRSTDATPHVAKAFAERDRRFRYVYEPQLGVSNARNRAISESRGAVIAFVDDDETVGKGWLRAIIAAFSDPRTEVIFARLYVLDQKGRSMQTAYSMFPGRDYGPDPIRVTKENCTKVMFGTGISAFRKSVFAEVGRFRADLGRRGRHQFGGEDTDMYFRCVRAGNRILYWPAAVAYHHIDAHRARWPQLAVRSFYFGINEARCDRVPAGKGLLGVPLFVVRGCLERLLDVARSLPRGRTATAAGLQNLAYSLGVACGSYLIGAGRLGRADVGGGAGAGPQAFPRPPSIERKGGTP